jgi:serine/threonine protein kinase/Tol biopolymer transport system component
VTPERWQEVKSVLAEALERAPAERHAYLEQTCTDPELRREVESLILQHEQTGGTFLAQPAFQSPAFQPPAFQSKEPPVGSRLGPYEILARIGSGGMGVVYKARDTRLGRMVALKLLANGALADQTARARLLREAQHASSLNHPNIATIYEVGEDAGEIYIALEFVEGRPFSKVIEHDGLPLETALRYALEISAALAHAHERGIVHRDLKPANVAITLDGHAKVLDFGLAKRLPAEAGEATLSLNSLSAPGTIVGTLQYMAPETLRGEPADARTDIWALGVVLSEMLSGAPPFHGRTAYELSSAILLELPAPLPPRIPASLQSVTKQCLAKEREQRYQRASEVRAALEAIRAHTAPSAEMVVPLPAPPPTPKVHRPRRSLLIGAGALLAILLLALGAFEWFHLKPPPPAAVPQENWAQITDFADSAVAPALSPDGRILTFIRGNDTFIGDGQIYAKLLPDGEPVQLTHDELPKMSPQFSSDGSTIAYTAGAWDTWTVPVLGGDARLMLRNAEGLTWIDPAHLLFSEIKTGIHMAVVTATSSRDQSRDVYVPPRERGMAHRSALSPDHKWVLIVSMDNGGWVPCRIVPFDGSSLGNAVGPQQAACTYAGWSPDQKWMYLNSDKGGRFHIWRQRFPDGEPQQITSGPTEEEGIAVTPDGSSLITSSGMRESTIWVRDRKGERQVSSEGYSQYPQFSPDGKKIYYLVRRHGISGAFISGELWVTDLESGRGEQLLPETLVTGYDISPDGTEVVFSAKDPAGQSHLWLASLDLRFPPREFSSPLNEDEPLWDRASRIYFRAAEGKSNFLYRMKEDGSERTKLLANPILEFHGMSPDGHWAMVAQTLAENQPVLEFAAPVDGGPPVIVCSVYCVSRWAADGKVFVVNISTMGGDKAVIFPVSVSNSLPALPPAGLGPNLGAENTNGAKVIDGAVILGPTADLSATVREDIHRNLYRVPLQ